MRKRSHRPVLTLSLAAALLGLTTGAFGQAINTAPGTPLGTPAPSGTGPSATPAPGTALGGPGRRTLGGPGAVRIGDPAASSVAPAPAPSPTPTSSFRELADRFDRAADPR